MVNRYDQCPLYKCVTPSKNKNIKRNRRDRILSAWTLCAAIVQTETTLSLNDGEAENISTEVRGGGVVVKQAYLLCLHLFRVSKAGEGIKGCI